MVFSSVSVYGEGCSVPSSARIVGLASTPTKIGFLASFQPSPTTVQRSSTRGTHGFAFGSRQIDGFPPFAAVHSSVVVQTGSPESGSGACCVVRGRHVPLSHLAWPVATPRIRSHSVSPPEPSHWSADVA